MTTDEPQDVIPFPRKIGTWSRVGMEACLLVALVIMLFFASGVANDLRDLRVELVDQRQRMATDVRQFEDARKRHTIQAATLMLELDRANDKAKLLTQKLKVTE